MEFEEFVGDDNLDCMDKISEPGHLESQYTEQQLKGGEIATGTLNI